MKSSENQRKHRAWSPSALSLEWPALARALSDCATFSTNRERLLHLDPESCATDREELLDLTAEMLRILAAGVGYFRFSDAPFAETLSSLRLGRILEAQELLAVRDLLAMSLRAAAFSREKEWPRRQSEHPGLFAICSVMQPNDKLHRRLERSLSDEGGVLDSASDELARARATVRAADRQMVTELERLLRSSSVRDALQDPVWMQRDGRYVLPVRTDRKSAIQGTTVSVSQTGSTLFIEPAVLAETRSQLERAQRDEKIAEARVLSELSRACAVPEVTNALETCAQQLFRLDDILARAVLARQMGAVRPILHANPRQPRFELVQARHPLYVIEGKECRANNLILEESQSADQTGRPLPLVMVLSGPNAGGKTVSMKTVGLIALMAQAGLYVPVVSAKLFSFRRVFAEIGDRQSREDDLSTFSAHLHALKGVLDHCNQNDLVLLDEGFVGTDPGMGAALARSVLEELASRKVCTVITTHFSQLKIIADDNPAFMNASMEFEPERLSPTYQLLSGIPGQSYAFELAERLGFAKELLDKARAYHGAESQRLERLLKELQLARNAVENEKAIQVALRKELEEIRLEAQKEYKGLMRLEADLNQRFNTEIQKRVNAFKNTLEIRERQFLRQRERQLNELAEETARAAQVTASNSPGVETVPTEQGTQPTLPIQSQAEAAARASRTSGAKKRQNEAVHMKNTSTPPRTFHDFQSLGQLQMGSQNRHRERKRHSRPADRRRMSGFDGDDWDDHQVAEMADMLLQADAEKDRLIEELGGISKRMGEEVAQSESLLESTPGERKRADRLRQLDVEDRKRKEESAPHPSAFVPGIQVKCNKFKATGDVRAKANSKGLVSCQFGLIHAKVHFTELRIVAGRSDSRAVQANQSAPLRNGGTHSQPLASLRSTDEPSRDGSKANRAELDVSLPPIAALSYYTVDLRGMHTDVALEKLDLFLDKALREDFPSIIVLHGHGTGAVKKAVRGFLKQLHMNCRYRPGTQGEGGDGVTVVVFN